LHAPALTSDSSIAESFGIRFRVDVERRIERARKVGAQDLDVAGPRARPPWRSIRW